MSRRMLVNSETDVTESMSLVDKSNAKIVIPHLRINFGFFDCYVKNFFELATLVRKYSIVGFRIKKQHLAIYNSSNLTIIHQDKIIKDFLSLYYTCYNLTESSVPVLVPLLEWQGRIRLQLQRKNVRFFIGAVCLGYSLVILFTLFKAVQNALRCPIIYLYCSCIENLCGP